ncbi:MAG: S1 RNA-binding domain-containing protein, partial [Pseudomonadota bacterium]
TGVTNFGVFVELLDLYVEGLVHITSLPSDYYHFEEAHHRLVGERTHQQFCLGDELTVQVASVKLDERKVDFEIASGSSQKQPKQASVRDKLRRGDFDSIDQATKNPGRKSQKKSAKTSGRPAKSNRSKKKSTSTNKKTKAPAKRSSSKQKKT